MYAKRCCRYQQSEGTGGVVNLMTVKGTIILWSNEPQEYVTPDVIADFTTVCLRRLLKNKVQISGGGERSCRHAIKRVSGYGRKAVIGEGEISYTGAICLRKGTNSSQYYSKDCRLPSKNCGQISSVCAVFYCATTFSHPPQPWTEVKIARSGQRHHLRKRLHWWEKIGSPPTGLPAGWRKKYINEVIGIVSVLIGRETIVPMVKYLNHGNFFEIHLAAAQVIRKHTDAFPYSLMKPTMIMLCATIAAARWREHLQAIVKEHRLRVMNCRIFHRCFLCAANALSGSVTTSLAMDTHGKISISFALLEMENTDNCRTATMQQNILLHVMCLIQVCDPDRFSRGGRNEVTGLP